jgi:hypothetical protein
MPAVILNGRLIAEIPRALTVRCTEKNEEGKTLPRENTLSVIGISPNFQKAYFQISEGEENSKPFPFSVLLKEQSILFEAAPREVINTVTQ